MREELAVELGPVELLQVVENIFHYEGSSGHEIVFLYAAEIADRSFYDREHPGTVLDSDSTVVWLPVKDVTEGRAILYPDGLVDLL